MIERLAQDLRSAFPTMKGFSRANLMYMRAFAEAWPDEAIVQQAVGQIPWGHNLVLLTKLKTPEQRLTYARGAIEHGWSRNVLTIHIGRRLLEREGKAVTNFDLRLPRPQSDLARESLKDPYLFDFLGVGDEAGERAIEDAIVQHITRFLLELGAGFAFVGRQVQIEVGGEDFFIDLLFCHLKLRCFNMRCAIPASPSASRNISCSKRCRPSCRPACPVSRRSSRRCPAAATGTLREPPRLYRRPVRRAARHRAVCRARLADGVGEGRDPRFQRHARPRDEGDAVLVDRLRAALGRLNPALSPEAIGRAIEELTCDRSAMSLEAANRETYRLLKDDIQVSVPDPEQRGQKTERLRVIDWAHPVPGGRRRPEAERWAAGFILAFNSWPLLLDKPPPIIIKLKRKLGRLSCSHAALPKIFGIFSQYLEILPLFCVPDVLRLLTTACHCELLPIGGICKLPSID